MIGWISRFPFGFRGQNGPALLTSPDRKVPAPYVHETSGAHAQCPARTTEPVGVKRDEKEPCNALLAGYHAAHGGNGFRTTGGASIRVNVPFVHGSYRRKRMNSWKVIVICLGLHCSIANLYGESHCQSAIDATRQPVSAPRGLGPTPRSDLPGHSAGFPVRLDLVLGTGMMEADGTKLIDFVITNIGGKPIKLPVSIDWNAQKTRVLTLYLTAAGGSFPVDHLTSAELFGGSGSSQTSCLLAPGKAMRVHASTRFRLTPGTHSFTAHAELVELVGGTSELLGTADSINVHKVYTSPGPPAR